MKNSHINGMKAGKAFRSLVTLFLRIRHQMLVNAGESSLKRSMVRILFMAIIIMLTLAIASALYYALGFIGPIIILLMAIAAPKIHYSSSNEDEYSFNDGYRDGPEGYGYYSGGYKIDD